MTDIVTPVPKSPLATLQTGPSGQPVIYITREWYRYLTSLTQAVGGSTTIIIDETIYNSYPDDSPDVGPIETLAQEADSYASQNAGQIEALRIEQGALDQQIPGPQELTQIDRALLGLTPFAPPPAELGSLIAAKNNVYRIMDAGNVTLVAGTATALSIQADGAREYCLTNRFVSGSQGFLSVGTITGGVSFVINSSNALDTSVVSWVILGPVRG